MALSTVQSMYEDHIASQRLSPVTTAKRTLTLDFQLSPIQSKRMKLDQSLNVSGPYGLQQQLETPDLDRVWMSDLPKSTFLDNVNGGAFAQLTGGLIDAPQTYLPPPPPPPAPVPSVVEDLAELDDDPHLSASCNGRLSRRTAVTSRLQRQEGVGGMMTSAASDPFISQRSAAAFPSSVATPPSYQTVQTDSCLSWTSSTSPTLTDDSQTVPILDAQERVKVEKKRERNRLAAQKCRQRKLEQIDTLQGRVDDLKARNDALEQAAEELRREMVTLRHHFSVHLNMGCQLMTTTAAAAAASVHTRQNFMTLS